MSLTAAELGRWEDDRAFADPPAPDPEQVRAFPDGSEALDIEVHQRETD